MSSSKAVTFSIAICTYNRSFLLKEQIECLNRLQIPVDHAVEVLYIDNNSTDDTESMLQEVAKACVLPIRVFKETEQGIAHARNRGWREAKGEYVLSLDDDAFPAEDWLVAYAKALDAWKPDVAGGPIIPFSKRPPPRWLDLNAQVNNIYVGRLDLYNKTQWLEKDETVWEANMAVRREAFEQYGGYDTNYGVIGVKGKHRYGGEGIEFQARLSDFGIKTLYVSDALVNHLVSEQKQRFMYYLRIFYLRAFAEYNMRANQEVCSKSWRSWRWMIKRIGGHAIKAFCALTKNQLPEFGEHSAKCVTYAGSIAHEWLLFTPRSHLKMLGKKRTQ